MHNSERKWPAYRIASIIPIYLLKTQLCPAIYSLQFDLCRALFCSTLAARELMHQTPECAATHQLNQRTDLVTSAVFHPCMLLGDLKVLGGTQMPHKIFGVWIIHLAKFNQFVATCTKPRLRTVSLCALNQWP